MNQYMDKYNKNRNVGTESKKTYSEKIANGFFDRYMSGKGMEIGGLGYTGAESILESAQDINFSTPGYDGLHLPFSDNSQDYLYSSHVLEHITDYKSTLKEWFRVLKIGGFMVIVVPHFALYEKKLTVPSNFNGDHRRFYSSANLLKEIEESLEINEFRIRHLRENDRGHDYNDGPLIHGRDLYEIEVVVEKLNKPTCQIK